MKDLLNPLLRPPALILVLVMVGLPITAGAGPLQIISTFDTDLDGWTKAPGSDAGSTVEWVATGGNPGGFLRLNEAATGNTDRVAAPAKFLGDKSAFIGGDFSMDRKTNILTSPITANDDIRLLGAGRTLRIDLPYPAIDVWTTETVALTHDAGWIDIGTGSPPTSTTFAEVMSNLTGIYLLADFRSGAEKPDFDNISMTAIPEPRAAAALVGVATLWWVVRRRAAARPPCAS